MGGSWGKAHVILSLFHDRTDFHCRCSSSRTSIFIADPGAPMKACSDCCADRRRVAVLLRLTRGRSSPHRGVPQTLPGSLPLLPQGRVVSHQVHWAGQVIVGRPGAIPRPRSGVWEGGDRGLRLKTPADLATRPGAVRPGRSS